MRLRFIITTLLIFISCSIGFAASANYVDLGLSVKWATCNLGATKSSENGELYAWGETATKSNFTWSNYVYANGSSSTVMNIGNDIAGTQYDAATALWGEDWRMPTEEEFKELLEKCTFTVATVDGVKGGKFTGPSGNSIFLPYAGCIYDGSVVGKGSRALYWTSTLTSTSQKASAFYITSGKPFMSTGYRRSGFSIRPVCNIKSSETPETPKVSYVDLGLSVKWATCNLGATKSSENGELYAWGETATKSNFTWSNYVYANGSSSTVMNIGNDIAGTQYDAATALWGEDWRMPTEEEFKELLEKCTFTVATVDGVKGGKFTGPSGNSIFLPYAGCIYDGSVVGKGSRALYWTSTLTSTSQKASAFYITSGKPFMSTGYRRSGFSIRPVCDTKAPEAPETPIISSVDLGLSVKWATCNLGATKSSENGELYAWGETATKSNFTWSNYVYANGSSSTVMNIGNDIAGTQYDAATALWGDDWRMPTEDEFKELLEKCTFTVATVDGVKGGKFTGPSGNSIFLPYAGCIYDGSVVGKGSRALYWTSTLTSTSQKASAFYITSGKPFMSTGYRRSGFSIRPVCDTKAPEAPENSEDPIINPNPEDSLWDSDAVDLGLSVKWASCNFRAEEETDLGELFAWGETDTKSDFTWSNYIYAEGSASSVMNIGSEISNTQYDPVFVSNSQNGDDQWRMPTGKEIQELKSKCTFKETSKGNVKGMTVTGPNGNSIFLPYGGCKYDGKVLGGGTAGYYWSGTLYSSNYGAYTLTIKNSVPSYSYCYRRTGVYIRPVCGEGSGESGIIDNPDPGYSGPGPSPILPDPYFSNHSLFDTDGIESVGESSTIDTDIYTLSGIKVDARNLKSGVYVRKGRKFVIK